MSNKSNNGIGEELEQAAKTLLTLIQKLMQELQYGQRRSGSISLDSSLVRELGFDSLTLSELMLRAEQHFQVSLPLQLLAKMETPRDLLREIMRAHATGNATEPSASPMSDVRDLSIGEARPVPDQVKTLPEVLNWHVQAHPTRPHIYLYGDTEQLEEITYGDLQAGAQEIAAGLLAHDIEAGQTIALMLPTCKDYFDCFMGILLAGCIPIPIYPPMRLSQLEDHLRRHAGILNNAQASLLITVPEAKTVAQLLKAQVPSLRGVVTRQELQLKSNELSVADSINPARELDMALLQYTSGSTGDPKGVILSHANLLANIRAMGRVMQVDSTDVFVSWLPLYHDMGLIGAWLGSLYFAMPLVSMPPLLFLTRPQRWLWAIHRHRGTLSASPNFGYELCLNQIKDEALEGLDLSCWRAAFNGAEPVSTATIKRFSERFAPFGFRADAMVPVYGLAESSVCLTMPPLGRPPLIDQVLREPLMRSGQAKPASPEVTDALQFVAAGQPLPGHQIRIVDTSGRELPERCEGLLEFCGPSVTTGYYRNAKASGLLFNGPLIDGQWLNSGDRAYMAGGDVFITGRSKDIIIRAGRNIYPQELEEAINSVPGVRKGCVAVFACTDTRTGTEQLVVLVETKETEEPAKEKMQRLITDLCLELVGTPPDNVILAPPHTVPKTSSGKIRRAASRELVEQDKISGRHRALWWQVIRLTLAGIKPLLRRASRHLTELGYASYSWLLMGLIAPFTWGLIALAPASAWSWAVARSAGKLLLRLSFTPVQVMGLDHLPKQGTCVLVANHASYLDGLMLATNLPFNYSFVAKMELRNNFIARIFLSRLGSEFVERFDLQKGVTDARHLARTVAAGRSLLFFPEGTFYRMPGLHSFNMGAFIAAVDALVPVVPISLRGTRSKLRGDGWFPRRGGISIHIGKPIVPQGSGWADAVQLRNKAREEILRHCGEPDLAQEDTPA